MVKPTESYVFPDLESAESKLRQTISSGELPDKLYAVYIYQLPIGKIYHATYTSDYGYMIAPESSTVNPAVAP